MRLFIAAKRANTLTCKLRQNVRRSSTKFWRARQAIAAAEFGLILPFLVVLMLGSMEVARFLIISRNVKQVAATMVDLLAQNGTGKVTYIDLHSAMDSTMVIFPQILQDAAQKNISWSNDISISMASVAFKPNPASCTSNCTYTANVVWNSGSPKRSCGVPLNSTADTAAPSNTTLPIDAFGPGSLIVVDIAFNSTPLFGLGLFGTVPIKHTAYLAPRDVPLIKYSVISGDDGIGTECPGY